MGCGLFGKLPSKRDFIAVDVPRRLLTVWEEWLQSGVAASREELGQSWQNAYLEAPIWRFWLGHEIAGTVVVGALMPSVDGIGRYFPLSVLAPAPEGMTLEPPTGNALHDWYSRIEAEMLRVLDAEHPVDPAKLAHKLPPPEFVAMPDRTPPPLRPAEGMSVWIAPGDTVAGTFAYLRQQDRDAVNGRRSYFWTLGGQNYRSQVIASSGMPDPLMFSGFLTGKFEVRQSS